MSTVHLPFTISSIHLSLQVNVVAVGPYFLFLMMDYKISLTCLKLDTVVFFFLNRSCFIIQSCFELLHILITDVCSVMLGLHDTSRTRWCSKICLRSKWCFEANDGKSQNATLKMKSGVMVKMWSFRNKVGNKPLAEFTEGNFLGLNLE